LGGGGSERGENNHKEDKHEKESQTIDKTTNHTKEPKPTTDRETPLKLLVYIFFSFPYPLQ
jgi:hypothetical protein